MKPISEDIKVKIRSDREQLGMSLYELAKKFNLSKSSVFTIIRGCDASKVRRASPHRRVVKTAVSMDRPDLSKTDLGSAAQQMICARLMLNGIKVFRPMTEDTPTDLLVLKNDGTVAKCQCKYIWPNGKGSHTMKLVSVRKNGPNSKAISHRYTLEEVDFFLGFCLDNDAVYVIPNVDTNGICVLAFWVSRDKVGTCGKGLDTSGYKSKFSLLK